MLDTDIVYIFEREAVYNVGISHDYKHLTCDSNDSADWWQATVELPQGPWRIKEVVGNTVILTDDQPAQPSEVA